MDERSVRRWVEAYIKAWNSNDPGEIGALFTHDAAYYTAPFREPWRGRDAIVEGWLDRKDEPGDTEFSYDIVGISGDLAFVQGDTHYKSDGQDYANLWAIRMAGDRASEYTEWWMLKD